MAIRPQTVANLASKFDSIGHDKVPLKKSNSRQLKLRTYDITKIINELNKINDEVDKTEKLNPSEKISQNDWSEENIEECGRSCGRTVSAGHTGGSAEAYADQLLHSDTWDRSVDTDQRKTSITTRKEEGDLIGNIVVIYLLKLKFVLFSRCTEIPQWV